MLSINYNDVETSMVWSDAPHFVDNIHGASATSYDHTLFTKKQRDVWCESSFPIIRGHSSFSTSSSLLEYHSSSNTTQRYQISKHSQIPIKIDHQQNNPTYHMCSNCTQKSSTRLSTSPQTCLKSFSTPLHPLFTCSLCMWQSWISYHDLWVPEWISWKCVPDVGCDDRYFFCGCALWGLDLGKEDGRGNEESVDDGGGGVVMFLHLCSPGSKWSSKNAAAVIKMYIPLQASSSISCFTNSHQWYFV